MTGYVAVWNMYHGDEAPDELEVLEVVGVDVGGRVDLQTVVVLAGVLKQTVHGIQHFVGEQEKPFPVKQCQAICLRESVSLKVCV